MKHTLYIKGTILALLLLLGMGAWATTTGEAKKNCSHGDEYYRPMWDSSSHEWRMQCSQCNSFTRFSDWNRKSDYVSVVAPFADTEVEKAGSQKMMVVAVNKLKSLFVMSEATGTCKFYKTFDADSTTISVQLAPSDTTTTLLLLVRTYDVKTNSQGKNDTTVVWEKYETPYYALHQITKMEVRQKYNVDSVGIKHPTNMVRFAIDNVQVTTAEDGTRSLVPIYKQDNQSEDVFAVERSFHSDFSTYDQIGTVYLKKLSMENVELISKTGDPEVWRGWFEYEDETIESQTKANLTGETAFAGNPDLVSDENLTPLQQTILKNFYTYPSSRVYYRVIRLSPGYIWGNTDGYLKNDSVSMANMLPAIDSIKVVKAANWSKTSNVTVNLTLNNPYPWDFNESLDAASLQAIAKSHNLELCRRYMWDSEARIIIHRWATTTSGEAVAMADRDFTVYGNKVKWDSKNNCFTVSVSDVQNLPNLLYYYSAVIDSTSTKYSLASKVPVKTSREDAQSCVSDRVMLVSNLTASHGENPSYVMVEWNKGDYDLESLSLERSEYGKNKWETLTTDRGITYFKDVSCNSGKAYEYRLTAGARLAYLDNRIAETTIDANGWRNYYGVIKGRVTMTDGTAMNGVKVRITRKEAVYIPDVVDDRGNIVMQGVSEGISADARQNSSSALSRLSALSADTAVTPKDSLFVFERNLVTDQSGYFSLDSALVVSTGVEYNVSVYDYEGDFEYKNVSTKMATILLSDEQSEVNDVVFRQTSISTVTGYVYYESSTVPVPNAHFLLNGVEMLDSDGNPVRTQADGKFRLTVPARAARNKVEIYKNGHTFGTVTNTPQTLPGVIIDGTQNSNRDGIIIYDMTKVRLAGHVCGGHVEGDKLLGYGLGKNNLGDDITLILELEGDNTASFIYDIHNPDKSEIRDTLVTEASSDSHAYNAATTTYTVYKKRIEIHADNKTGEFMVDLFPAKYRVTQMYCKGYANLYSAGEGKQIIDLCSVAPGEDGKAHQVVYDVDGVVRSTNYDAQFIRVYHNPLTVTYKQNVNGRPVDYFGELRFSDTNILGQDEDVLLYDKDSSADNKYLFSHPVFQQDSRYMYHVYAHEDYLYNNEVGSNKDIVPIPGDTLTVRNLMEGNEAKSTVVMDDNGEALVMLEVKNPEFTQVGEAALRSVQFTVKNNGYYYDATPLKGYVLGLKQTGNEVLPLGSTINVVDVLRDPPGSSSYAYRESGTTYTWSYDKSKTTKGHIDFKVSAGAAAKFGVGMMLIANSEIQGTVDGSISADVNVEKTRVKSEYTMTLKDKISTSADGINQGAMADVYIGTVDTYGLRIDERMTVVDSNTFAEMKTGIDAGSIKVVAKNNDNAIVVGDNYSVVRNGQHVFAYNQKHIVNTVIPGLQKRLANLLTAGDSATVLKEGREETVYWQSPTTGKIWCQFGSSDAMQKNLADSILSSIQAWKNVIIDNERTKVTLINKKSPKYQYTVSGSGVEYSEEASSYNNTQKWDMPNPPIVWSVGASGGRKPTEPKDNTADDDKAKDKEIESLDKDSDKNSESSKNDDKDSQQGQSDQKDDDSSARSLKGPRKANNILAGGFILELSISGGTQSTSDIDRSYIEAKSAGYGFVMNTSSDNYFDVAVHRVNPGITIKNSTAELVNTNIESDYKATYDSDTQGLHNCVFELKGGAQRNPWFAPDSTLYYCEGTPLGAQLLKIDNPKIYIDKPYQDNVSRDENAVFTIRLTNASEVEVKDASLMAPSKFFLRLDDSSNPLGAKVYMDGQPISDGRSFILAPGESVTKTIEVQRGQTGYNYDNIRLQFYDEGYSLFDYATLSVHYLPVSTPVTLSLPTDKWVMNTNSQLDNDGLYYMPCEISGFSVNYDNFDHIEMQYRKHTEGDNGWINLCSYYYDKTLYDKATGNKAMIENASKIDKIKFYGGTNIEEQEYDLRAVSFCRLGNGYVTRSSSVLQGIKDTRRPEIFGVPSPANGILTFEDVIQFPYTEKIAYNHLNATSNFTVRGYTNDTQAVFQTPLHFSGQAGGVAYTDVDRSLAGRDFTVDMMVKTDSPQTNVVIFAHGTDEVNMGLGLICDSILNSLVENSSLEKQKYDRLYFYTNDYGVFSEPLSSISPSRQLSRVGVVVRNNTDSSASNTAQVSFICGSDSIGVDLDFTNKLYGSRYLGFTPYKKELPQYMGTGPVYIGNTDKGNDISFNGEITEVRLWGEALSSKFISQTYNKRISGYAGRLIDYWPMNEAEGSLAYDKVNGATLNIKKASWQNSRDYSLKADHRQVKLRAASIAPATEEDYTMQMWFRVDSVDAGATDSIGIFRAGSASLSKDKGRMFLGLKKDKYGKLNLVLTSHDKDYELGSRESFADGNWHSYALSKSQTQNAYSVYLDGSLVSQGLSDAVDVLASDYMSFGDEKAIIHVDEFALFNKALPVIYFTDNAKYKLNGIESDLKTYLPFSHTTVNDNNETTVTFSLCSEVKKEKTYYVGNNEFDKTGDLVTDTAVYVLADAKVVADGKILAPTVPVPELSNLDFSWSSTGTALQINLKREDKDINKQYVYVTVRDVEDEQGNTVRSPHTWSYFVDKNVLRWTERSLDITIPYGQGYNYNVDWKNLSGKQTTYSVTNKASWLKLTTFNSSSTPVRTLVGTADAEEEQQITLHISDGLSPGTYSETLLLTDMNGLSDPLTINLRVEANDPGWTVDKTKYEYSMNMKAEVHMTVTDNSAMKIGNTEIIDNDTRDKVGAFVGLDCVGVANINVDDASQAYVYLTIYGDSTMLPTYRNGKKVANGAPVTLRLWNSSTGVVSELDRYITSVDSKPTPLTFVNRARYGMPTEDGTGSPNILRVTNIKQQEFNLSEGWNWISLNVEPIPDAGSSIISTSRGFVDGDVIKRIDIANYDDKKQDFTGSLSSMDNEYVFQVYSKQGAYMTVRGKEFSVDSLSVELKGGSWCDMPYYLKVKQPLSVALSDCRIGEKATIGDVIKAYDSFAVAGVNGWEGTLQYLTPGEGYYYYHSGKSTSFHYNSNNNTITQTTANSRRRVGSHLSETSMPVIAVLEDSLGYQPGDVLQVYCNGELVSETEAINVGCKSQDMFFLSVNAQEGQTLTFCIKRGEYVLKAATKVKYNSRQVVGSLDEPCIISMTADETVAASPGDYYTVQGFKVGNVNRAPSGIYITNNRKISKK